MEEKRKGRRRKYEGEVKDSDGYMEEIYYILVIVWGIIGWTFSYMLAKDLKELRRKDKA